MRQTFYLALFPTLLLVCGCPRYAAPGSDSVARGPGASSVAGSPPSGSAPKTSAAPARRTWAERLNEPGLPNLHRVTEDLYRGAQPTADGMKRLKEMGVRTAVNLRSFHSDGENLADTGLAYEHIPMEAWHPETEDVVRFLRIVSDKSRGPFFVHCQHGADRTGLMCAVYRILICGWTKEEAIKEMTEGGFGYHVIWRGLIEYLKDLDIEDMKRQVGRQ